MTAEETMSKLINMGIVSKIGDTYNITSRASDLFAEEDAKNVITINEYAVDNSLYPKEIREASMSNKVKAILDYCKVPVVSDKGSFMLRSNDGLTKKSILGIIQDKDISPPILLKAIRDYYTNIEFPKSFKNFVKDGDIFSIYKYYESGRVLDGNSTPNNELWL